MVLAPAIDAVAHATSFSGVVRVDRAEGTVFVQAYGLADRARGVVHRAHAERVHDRVKRRRLKRKRSGVSLDKGDGNPRGTRPGLA